VKLIKDVDIKVKKGRIVFSCPSCETPDAFSPGRVKKIRVTKVALKCSHCEAMATFNMPKVEAFISELISKDPKLENPIIKEIEDEAVSAPSPPDQIMRPKGDMILMVDYGETFREAVRIIFSDIARVEAYGGGSGAAVYIKKHEPEIKLIIMDFDLGDEYCLKVLDGIKDNEEASKIPVIVVCPEGNNEEKVRERLPSYPQIISVYLKKDLIKKLKELMAKLGGG
jgi:CheY-like chemotaxis protein